MKKYYLKNLGQKEIENLCKRPAIDFTEVFQKVKSIFNDVKKDGDQALKEYTKKFDGVELADFCVTEKEIEEACSNIDEKLKTAFEIAANNIQNFQAQTFNDKQKIIETSKGVKCFVQTRVIEKVGLYIPGGTAPLPSTALMLGIPARIAGCREIIMCTPPGKDGKIPACILYAARLAGITKIFKLGGAQAIAAMAYGTDTIPKVYKIFGPGNQYVTAAKMIVMSDPEGCAIDLPAGPSEVLVIADKDARADFVAVDLLSQAEHGPDSQVVLVSIDDKKTDEVLAEIDRQIELLPRRDIAKKSLEKSFCVEVNSIKSAVLFSNTYAPEHLILNIKNPEKYANEIINAGSVFLGQWSCESAGDYASGTNHTLPTYGYARMYSGVSVDSFVKKISFQKISKKGIKNLGPTVITLAETENLSAHKNAMELRFNEI